MGEKSNMDNYFLEDNFMSTKPNDWPRNGREAKLELIAEKIREFELNPSYRSRELLLAIVCDNDANQYSSFGEMRVTEFEAELINIIYFKAERLQINSIKVYLYDLITEATRLQKIMSWCNPVLGEEIEDSYRIKPYEDILFPQMKLYHYAYQKYTIEKNANFASQLIEIIEDILKESPHGQDVSGLACAFLALLTDVSYMRGNQKEKLWEFTRDDLYKLLSLEARLLKLWGKNILERPVKGMIKIQISNYILKSRNGYNEDYICKYVSRTVAEASARNHEIWMKEIEKLNDEREQKVIPELFHDTSWIPYQWAKDFDFTPPRHYFVSSFSKTIYNADMQKNYGECIYGYKNDRIFDLIGPIGMQKLKKKDGVYPEETISIPFVSQVIAFDVIYDKEEAKSELKYLLSVVDLFDLSDEQKHSFMEELLQYWILSVKDYKWHKERERRYVIFMYDDYEYIETTIEDDFLKVCTSIFILPDFILGNNPVREKIRFQVENKQKALISKEYFHCKNCLMQDYDVAVYKMPEVCPICGSKQVEMVYPK